MTPKQRKYVEDNEKFAKEPGYVEDYKPLDKSKKEDAEDNPEAETGMSPEQEMEMAARIKADIAASHKPVVSAPQTLSPEAVQALLRAKMSQMPMDPRLEQRMRERQAAEQQYQEMMNQQQQFPLIRRQLGR